MFDPSAIQMENMYQFKVATYNNALFELFGWQNLKDQSKWHGFMDKAKLMYKKEFFRGIFFLCANLEFTEAIWVIWCESSKQKETF